MNVVLRRLSLNLAIDSTFVGLVHRQRYSKNAVMYVVCLGFAVVLAFFMFFLLYL
jgi:hypothetical protein